jgi:transposase InsO family protein
MPRPLLRISASEPNASLVLRRRLELLSQDYEVTNPQRRLLSDNESCYISGELKSYLVKKEEEHIRGKPMHPQTQGIIEPYNRTIKNRILLEHYYSPEEL